MYQIAVGLAAPTFVTSAASGRLLYAWKSGVPDLFAARAFFLFGTSQYIHASRSPGDGGVVRSWSLTICLTTAREKGKISY
jgi:hypothetical protein